MQDFYAILTLLTAGVSIAMGTMSLFIGIEKRDRTYLVFGIISLSLVLFILIPPVGFIQQDQPPYPVTLVLKRIFIFLYYGLFPWFIFYYTGSGKERVPTLLTALIAVTFSFMIVATSEQSKLVWSIVALIGFIFIFLFGMVSGIAQYRRGDTSASRWFLLAIAMFGVMIVITAINHLGNNIIERSLGIKLYSLHLHSLSFTLIMGIRLVVDIFEKYRVEKLLRASDKRWELLMQNAGVFVMELSREGNIGYINNFGLRMLGYKKAEDVRGKNWFQVFLHSSEAASIKPLFENMIDTQEPFPYLKTKVRSKQGKEFTVSWVNFFTFTDEGALTGVMCVGKDVSIEESAFQIINQWKLKAEGNK